MKKNIFFVFFILPFFGFSQIEKQTSRKISLEFESFYNSNKFESIFELFSDEMKMALPSEKSEEFLKGLKSQAGKIIKMEFIKYENGTYASYKTNFEKALLAVNISLDQNAKINGFFIKPFQDTKLPVLERNKTEMILPFKEQWTVIWGGDTKELNYHVESEAQKHAFDMVITDENKKSYKSDGLTNEDYYAFGKELIAPCKAEVVLVVDGIKDNIPGEVNPIYIPGNTVILKTANNEYIFFAHFKQNSILVKQGQTVNKGDLLGLCGNSGNSTEAHLHFHIQNIENMNNAIGAKCFFKEMLVNGDLKNDYSPIQGDKIRNK